MRGINRLSPSVRAFLREKKRIESNTEIRSAWREQQRSNAKLRHYKKLEKENRDLKPHLMKKER